MTRTDWGEGFTYNGPLNAEYFSTRETIELVQMVEGALIDAVEEPEMAEYYLSRIPAIIDGLEIRLKTQQ